MGRFLKNPELAPGALAAKIPVVPSSAYGDSPVNGLIRFNQASAKVELFYNNVWNEIAKIGRVNLVQDTFTTANATTQYGPMTYSYSSGQEANAVVYVGGVMQVPGTNYQFQGNTYMLLNPTNGTSGQTITVIHNINSTDAV